MHNVNNKATLILSLSAAALIVPTMVHASSLYHDVGGEVGATTNPSHVSDDLLRGDVQRTVDAARKDGSLAILSRGGVVPVKATGPGKTREQVRQEYISMTPEEKARLQELHGR
jgi:hypothetical protein